MVDLPEHDYSVTELISGYLKYTLKRENSVVRLPRLHRCGQMMRAKRRYYEKIQLILEEDKAWL